MFRAIRPNKRWVLVLLGLLLLGFVVFRALFGSGPVISNASEPFRYPIDALAVQPTDARPELELAGRVTAGRRVAVVAPFDGRIESVEVSAGREIAAGDMLLRLDRRLIEMSLAETRRKVENTDIEIEKSKLRQGYLEERLVVEEDRLTRANDVREQAQRLYERKLITVMDYESYVASEDDARLQILDIRREIKQLELDRRRLANDRDTLLAEAEELSRNLKHAELTANVDGVVLDVQIAAGEQVASGTELMTVAPRDLIEIEIPWPNSAGAGDGVSAWALFPDITVALDIAEIGSVIASGQASPTAKLIGRGPLARRAVVGSFIPIRLRLPAVPDAFVVPSQALYAGDRVFRIPTESTSLAGVPVTVVGRTYDREGQAHWVVRSNMLGAGDRILASRLAAASDGLPVEIDNMIEVRAAQLDDSTSPAVAASEAAGGSVATKR